MMTADLEMIADSEVMDSFTKTDLIETEVVEINIEAENIISLELRSEIVGEILPRFTPGSHIDIVLPIGLCRSYSLVNSTENFDRYVIAVQRDPHSTGGSAYIHDHVKPGDRLTINHPRNHFPLDESAAHSVFIAGGIGITPLWCMIQRLESLGRSWELHYAARNPARAAFLNSIVQVGERSDRRVESVFDAEPGAVRLDIGSIVGEAPKDSHFYCCGPISMLSAFEESTTEIEPGRVHMEYFKPRGPLATNLAEFSVELRKSAKILTIEPGRSILDCVRAAGVPVNFSCQQGLCGLCETKVLSGTPEHHDSVLTEEERVSNNVMMICCSTSKSKRLVLDL